MTTDPDTPRLPDRDQRELRLAVFLLAFVMGLLITGAAVYLTREHPALAQPLGVGAAVMSALAATAGLAAPIIRR